MAQDGLTDSLPKYDPTYYGPAYNNTTDRLRIELPPVGDIAASGVVTVNVDPTAIEPIKQRFTYNANNDIDTIKTALIATPSGSPCKLSTFTYNANNDIDYIIESVDTW